MQALYQKTKQVAEMKCNPHLRWVRVDLDDDFDIQCKKCLIVVAPLHSVDFYMQVLRNEERHGSDFLVLARQAYTGLTISKDMTLVDEDPFECMYLKKASCRRCNNPLGVLFETTNINGTKWLLSKIALRMEDISIMSAERNLLDTLRTQLQKITPSNQNNRVQRIKQNYKAQEHLVKASLRKAVDPIFFQNKLKQSVVEAFLNELAEIDKCMSYFENRGTIVIQNANKLLGLYMKLFPQLKKQARQKDLMKKL